jgi:S-adenosylmethionine synthetase
MTLEAHAGKNPCTHVGKLLSIAASRAAEACAGIDGVRAAECVLVSRIGAPVSDPQSALVRVDAPSRRAEELEERAHAIVAEQCRLLPDVWRELVECS